MLTQARILMSVWTLLVWGLVGLSAVFWGLKLTEAPPLPAPRLAASATAQAVPQVKAAQIASWLGAAPGASESAAGAASSRYELRGVIAQGRNGVALLAVDGQPAKPYLVGSLIHEGVILRSVGPRHAELAADRGGPVIKRLELPPPDTHLPDGLTLSGRATR
jgi:general secretion pathway protein C